MKQTRAPLLIVPCTPYAGRAGEIAPRATRSQARLSSGAKYQMFLEQRQRQKNEQFTNLFFKGMAVLFFIFICFVLFDGLPFQKRDIEQLTLAHANYTGEGDSGRQIFYIALAGMTAGLAFFTRGLSFVTRYPLSMMMFMGWCFLSVFWAIDPSIALRRSVLGVIFILITLNFVIVLETDRVFRILHFTLAVIIVMSLIGVFVIPGYARHPGAEQDPALAGAWKGAFPHKNIAAMVATVGFILFYHRFLTVKTFMSRLFDVGLCFVALVFLLGTGGKSAFGLLVPSVAVGHIYRHMGTTKQNKMIYLAGFIFGLSLIFGLGIVFNQKVIDLFENPLSFTGRVAIWKAVLTYASQHPFTGSGFGSFWQVGQDSPIKKITSQSWVLDVLHSHNGYLEVLLTTGLPGMVLAIIATIAVPLKRIVSAPKEQIVLSSMLLSLLVFCILINLMETQLFARDRQVWLLFLVVVMTSQYLRVEKPVRSVSQSGSSFRQMHPSMTNRSPRHAS